MPLLSRIEGPEDLKSLTHEQLAEVALDCRKVIIETITKTGGHLASNLGVVELTLALHRAFDSPKDRLVWDTSNQCYTHKLVTGRRDQFASIRTPGGLSGFAEPTESAHDTLAAGHAGTGLSYGLGHVDGASGRAGGSVRRGHRRRRRPDLGPELRGPEQHRPHQAEAADRHPERQRLVDLRERRLAGALAQPLRAPPDVPEVHRGGPQLLQAPAERRQGVGARAQGQELRRGPLLPEPDLGRARLPLRRAGQRPRLPGARGGAGARPRGLEGRDSRRHPRADAQGPRLPAGRAESLQVPPAGHADRPRGRGRPVHLLPGLREDADRR